MKKNLLYIILAAAILAAAGITVGIWQADTEGNKSLSSAPSSSLSAASSPSLIAQVSYVCNGGKTIQAAFYKGESESVKPGEPPIPSGSAKIILSDGRNFDLPQTISADGGRYANSDESFVFWIKGDGATVLENNVEKNYTDCVVSDKNSPAN